MPAYVIADIRVTDPVGYAKYRSGVEATLAEFGGRFLVRGGIVEAFEGDWRPERLIVIEFPDKTAANAWYKSAAYKPLLDLRLASSDGRLIVAEGV